MQPQPTAFSCFPQVNFNLFAGLFPPCFPIHTHTSTKLDCSFPAHAPNTPTPVSLLFLFIYDFFPVSHLYLLKSFSISSNSMWSLFPLNYDGIYVPPHLWHVFSFESSPGFRHTLQSGNLGGLWWGGKSTCGQEIDKTDEAQNQVGSRKQQGGVRCVLARYGFASRKDPYGGKEDEILTS